MFRGWTHSQVHRSRKAISLAFFADSHLFAALTLATRRRPSGRIVVSEGHSCPLLRLGPAFTPGCVVAVDARMWFCFPSPVHGASRFGFSRRPAPRSPAGPRPALRPVDTAKGGSGPSAADRRRDLQAQSLGAKRLDDIVAHAGLLRLGDLARAGLGRDHDEGQRREGGIGAHLAQ